MEHAWPGIMFRLDDMTEAEIAVFLAELPPPGLPVGGTLQFTLKDGG